MRTVEPPNADEKATKCGSVVPLNLPTVDVSKTIIQAEIRPGHFEIIDGNHLQDRFKSEM
ncbi:hypothetical protein [Rossellomorea aquimaris]|uniref:hypothetical protein n=1 Tax=Rossellomorea aquimaris TaxID=189382 RepID=UPI000DEA0EA6|nr:hypothetical protein [Rossellomorea aquimaris]